MRVPRCDSVLPADVTLVGALAVWTEVRVPLMVKRGTPCKVVVSLDASGNFFNVKRQTCTIDLLGRRAVNNVAIQ